VRNENDFSRGERGKFLRENKVQKTLRLDADILKYFQALSSRKHIPYQTLINNTLREAMEHSGSGIDLKLLKKEIRLAVQSALRKSPYRKNPAGRGS
jgi:hypothetical protein